MSIPPPPPLTSEQLSWIVAIFAMCAAWALDLIVRELERAREWRRLLTRRVYELEGSPTYHGDGVNPDRPQGEKWCREHNRFESVCGCKP